MFVLTSFIQMLNNKEKAKTQSKKISRSKQDNKFDLLFSDVRLNDWVQLILWNFTNEFYVWQLPIDFMSYK